MDRATSAAVMIQRMTSFVVFFSSAIAREYSIPRTAVQVSLGTSVNELNLGLGCCRGCIRPFISGELHNLPDVNRLGPESESIIDARVGREPIPIHNLPVRDKGRIGLDRLVLLFWFGSLGDALSA